MNNKSTVSIHDNIVLGYEVDATIRRLIIRTKYTEHGAEDRTNIIFSGIEDYRIENDSFGTILNSIDEINPLQMLEDQWALMKTIYGNSIWPGNWAQSYEKAKDHIAKANCRAFYITSSLGMEG